MKFGHYKLRLPENIETLGQDQEYCILAQNGNERRIRFHDYHEIYSIPGLYETIFSDLLKCGSPDLVSSLLLKEVSDAGMSPSDLTVLDLGAGNGLVGQALQKRGVRSIVAVDIIEEAATAARRDRPEVYEKYYIQDMCDIAPETLAEFENRRLNCMTCVAALGFDDIPPAAFISAFNLIRTDGWVAFTIKGEFVESEDQTGFSCLIQKMVEDGKMDVNHSRPYCHRMSVAGEPLEYVAMVGRKRGGVTSEYLV